VEVENLLDQVSWCNAAALLNGAADPTCLGDPLGRRDVVRFARQPARANQYSAAPTTTPTTRAHTMYCSLTRGWP
jgi:hypothetical protein